MAHLNSSSPVVDPSLYGYGGQKRSLDEGGESSLHASGMLKSKEGMVLRREV